MKTMIQKMVETMKRWFVQRSMRVSIVVDQHKLIEKKPEKVDKPTHWSQAMTLQLKKYLENNFVFRYNSLTGATEFRGKM